jgi:membrane peptidoglycan carboxypeptidase
VAGLAAVFLGVEWQKFQVRPFPISMQGPVVVYARDGSTPLRPPFNNAHRELNQLSEFSHYLPNALVASEDSRYYWHFGVDPIGTLRALSVNLRGGSLQGGSTLTQQLARSLFREYVGTEDSAGRKIREAIVSLKLETFYNKDELLLTYLNRVYLGIDLFGFEDAARFYFAKSAADLTLSEAATLVGILPAPNAFNPVQNYELAVKYRNGVIYRMRRLGMVTQEEADRARRSRIEVNPRAVEILGSTIAPYFYSHVFAELEELLGEQLAREGNFIVETSLDPAIQTESEKALQNAVQNAGTQFGFSQGAIVTLDSRTGEILAMTGGVDYRESQFNRATQALRQPGSTFKVFAYSAALDRGVSPGQTFSCAPLSWSGQSYSGCERSSGAIDMYQAMAQSENSVALRIAREAGLDRVVQMARRLGIQSDLKAVPGLVLGQSEVTVLELTGAFGAIANRGVRNRPHAIQRIFDSSDCSDRDDLSTCRVIYDYQSDRTANADVLSGEVSDTLTVLLQGVIQGGTGRNASLGLDEAGKTGTTNDNVDLWFVGYVPSQELVTGVWLGNDDNSPTAGSSAQAAQLWRDYMRQILP